MMRLRVHPADLEESIKELNDNGYTVVKSREINKRVVELVAEKVFTEEKKQSQSGFDQE